MDQKAIAEMLVQGVKPEADEADPSEETVDEGQMACAEEAMEALKSGDVQAFALALRSFFAMA